jgi:hypothetical protein
LELDNVSRGRDLVGGVLRLWRWLNPEIVVGFLAATVLWAGVLGWQAAYAPTEMEKQECYETAKKSGHKTEECKSIWERTTTDPVALFTFGLFIFTAVLGGATIGLLSATNRTAKIAERGLVDLERAFVFIDGFDFELTLATDAKTVDVANLPEIYRAYPELCITRFAIFPRWKNSGSTPTKNMVIWAKYDGPNTPVIPNFDTNFSGNIFFLAPNAVEISEIMQIPSARKLVDWGMRPVGDAPQILIWGRADYEDVFGARHFVEWCYELRFSRPDTGRMRPSFIQRGEFCRTEQS